MKFSFETPGCIQQWVILLLLSVAGLPSQSQDQGLPGNFPEITFLVNENPSDEGYLFLAPFEKWGSWTDFPPYMIIMDNRGTPVFYESSNGTPIYDFKVQPGGLLTFYGSDRGTCFHVLDTACRDVAHIYGDGSGTDFHELMQTDSGTFLMIAWDDRLVDMDTVVPGGHPGVTVRGNKVQELTLGNELVKEYNTWDYYDITDAYEVYISLTDPSFIDYVHLNTVEIDSDTSLLLLPRNINEVTKIHRETGEVIWRLGGKNNQFEFINDTLGFSMPHDVRRLPGGNLQIFDNGTEYNPPFSNVVEYEVDEENFTATLIKRYRSEPDDIFGFIMGSAQRMENGNVLVGWGSGYPNVTEFRPDGTKAMELAFNGQHYRVRRFDWQPRAFTFDTCEVDFGDVRINDTATAELAIANHLDEPIEINSVVIFEEAFRMADGQMPVTIAPGDTASVTVLFNPSITGPFEDKVTFCYDIEDGYFARRLGSQVFMKGNGYDDTGISEGAMHGASIYPNPGNGPFVIETDHPFKKIMICSLGGRVLMEQVIYPPAKKLAVSQDIPAGPFLVKVVFDDNSLITLKYLIIR